MIEDKNKIDKRDFDFELPELVALKNAIEGMLPNYKNPRIKILKGKKTIDFLIDREENGSVKEFQIEQLSSGYRTILAMAMDISARMSQANPHLANKSEAIILIDELDLHLHPKWQQTILSDLRRTFPNAQFIVTTHSPHIISSIQKEKLFKLENGEIQNHYQPTYGKPIDELLLSSFNLESLRYPKIQKKITFLENFIYSNEYNEKKFNIDLKELAEEIGRDDIAILKLKLEKLKRDKNAKNR
jgi:predicted ATP-binding protein involved in virulence